MFEVQPNIVLTSVLQVYLWDHLKTLVYSTPIENKQTLHQRIFYACQTTHTCPGTFENVRQSTIRHVQACTDSGAEHFKHSCELQLDEQ